ncbi:hypothetical protein [Mycolicibacterium sphagni]|uniref:hypothetical protein n=1 Tax=Mycolicibacterium sphagni TaxID=1786 RepID=UPI0021F27FF6|nr:hypothetical protein [Mycolicibacterium sphagni]MCV7179640.1 hypothetical protein [Mycolicibacterium sphagni]
MSTDVHGDAIAAAGATALAAACVRCTAAASASRAVGVATDDCCCPAALLASELAEVAAAAAVVGVGAETVGPPGECMLSWLAALVPAMAPAVDRCLVPGAVWRAVQIGVGIEDAFRVVCAALWPVDSTVLSA